MNDLSPAEAIAAVLIVAFNLILWGDTYYVYKTKKTKDKDNA